MLSKVGEGGEGGERKFEKRKLTFEFHFYAHLICTKWCTSVKESLYLEIKRKNSKAP